MRLTPRGFKHGRRHRRAERPRRGSTPGARGRAELKGRRSARRRRSAPSWRRQAGQPTRIAPKHRHGSDKPYSTTALRLRPPRADHATVRAARQRGAGKRSLDAAAYGHHRRLTLGRASAAGDGSHCMASVRPGSGRVERHTRLGGATSAPLRHKPDQGPTARCHRLPRHGGNPGTRHPFGYALAAKQRG